MPARRRALFAAVAAAAVLGGAGLAWWRTSLRDSADGAVDAFWRLDFATPDGGRLAMSSLRGKPLLLNFWATWCPPCVDELPMLDAFYRERAAVNAFLGRQPLHFPVAMAGTSGVELSRSLGNLSGGLPFSVVLGQDGAVLHRKIGRIKPDDLRAWTALR